MTNRRKHSKITQLPPEIVEAVNKKLAGGTTYRDIAEWINGMSEETGIEVSHMSVQRYGKDFLTRLEKLRLARDQARAIVEDNKDRPATEMTEAASNLAVQMIQEYFMKVQNEGGEIDKGLIETMKALAQLERSSVAREKLKLEFRQKAEQAVKAIEETGRQKGLDAETLTYIKEQVYGIL